MPFSIPKPVGGDVNRGLALELVSIISFSFAVIVLATRLAVRYLLVKQFSWDDGAITLATAVGVVNFGFSIKYTKEGGGRHIYYIGTAKAIEASKWSTLSTLNTIWIVTLTKISIALLVLRINNKKGMRMFMWILMALLLTVNGGCFAFIAASCHPFKRLWSYTTPGHCASHQILIILSYVQGVFTIVTDFACTILPIIILWNVKISIKQKVAIWALIGSGLLTTACSIVRMVLYSQANFYGDHTFNLIPLQIWSLLEQNIGLIAANLPALRPLGPVMSKQMSASYSRLRSLFSTGTHTSSTVQDTDKASSEKASYDDTTALPLYSYSYDGKSRAILTQYKPAKRSESTPWRVQDNIDVVYGKPV